MEPDRENRRIAESVLLRRVAESLAESESADEGLSGIVPLLVRFLGADLGVFLVRRDGNWTTVGQGADETFCRSLPRTARLVVRAATISLAAGFGCRSAAQVALPAAPDSVVVPVRVGRRCLGYGIFRIRPEAVPSPATLRLLDAVGAQVGAFCENVFRGERIQTDRDRLARANEELGWLLRFSETLHVNADEDTMFQWLSRELDRFSAVSGVELVSLHEVPVIRIGAAPGTKPPAGRDGKSVARAWSEILSSRYRVSFPAGEFKVKRFGCLAATGNGRAGRPPASVRTIETPLYHEGQIVGLLAVHMPAGAEGDRRMDERIASVAGQIGLFLHRNADLEKIRSLANHDKLTGLLNYLSFQDIFEREFERYQRHARNMSLLLLDLDNFKRINDTFGHQVGDQVLRKVARILKANLRKTDHAFRCGGDEFVVLMAETDAEKAAVLARRIRSAFNREIHGFPSFEFAISASIGIADCRSLSSPEREELLFRADEALYRSKNAGRDRIEVAQGKAASDALDVVFASSQFPAPARDGVRLTQGTV